MKKNCVSIRVRENLFRTVKFLPLSIFMCALGTCSFHLIYKVLYWLITTYFCSLTPQSTLSMWNCCYRIFFDIPKLKFIFIIYPDELRMSKWSIRKLRQSNFGYFKPPLLLNIITAAARSFESTDKEVV